MEKINVWQKTKIKNLEINNRIIRSATNEHLGDLDGTITKDYIKVYENLSKSGVGLIITSQLSINNSQRADITHICIDNPNNIEYFKTLTNLVHNYGSKIIGQISYGGHRANKIPGNIAKSPSGIDNSYPMSLEDIKECIKDYVNATLILQETGFDGVQLHIAHQYLLSEFLDPFYNKRTDNYGGNIENRYRIVHEILEELKKVVNSNFIVTAKINVTSKDTDYTNFLDDQIQVCKYLEQDGLNAIELSGADYLKFNQPTPYYLESALKIKKAISIPVILVGGFRNMKQINSALEKGIDFVSMCRPFISEEDFIEKLKNNQTSRCINCNKCFEVFKTKHTRCVFRNDIIPQLEVNFPS